MFIEEIVQWELHDKLPHEFKNHSETYAPATRLCVWFISPKPNPKHGKTIRRFVRRDDYSDHVVVGDIRYEFNTAIREWISLIV